MTQLGWREALGWAAATYVAGMVVAYAAGRVLVGLGARGRRWSAAGPGGYEGIFVNCLTGLLFGATVEAIVVTRFQTVLMLLVPPGLLILRELNRGPSGAPKPQSRCTAAERLDLALVGAIVFGLFAAATVRPNPWTAPLFAPHIIDWGLYGVDIETLRTTGQENSYHVHNILSADYHGRSPYHYVELWAGALIRDLGSPLLALEALGAVIYPLTTLLAIVGGWTFLGRLGFCGRAQRYLVLAAFLGSGWFAVDTPPLNRILPEVAVDLNGSLVSAPKRMVPFCILMAAGIAWLRGERRVGVLALALLPIVSAELAPSAIGAVAVVWMLGRSARTAWVDTLPALAHLGVFLALGSFYAALGNRTIPQYDIVETARGQVAGGWLLPLLYGGRALVLIVLLYPVQLWLVWRFAGGPQGDARFREMSTFGLVAVGVGILGWAAFYRYVDGIQFLTGILCLVQTALMLAGLAMAGLQGDKRIRVGVAGVVVLGAGLAARHYAPKDEPHPCQVLFWRELTRLKVRSPIGGSIQGRADFERSWAQRHIVTHALGDEYIPFSRHLLKTVELGVEDLPQTAFRTRPGTGFVPNLDERLSELDNYRSRVMKESGIFSRYLSRRRERDRNVMVADVQADFLDSHGIDWVLVSSKAPRNPVLEARAIRSMESCPSGERLIVLAPRAR